MRRGTAFWLLIALLAIVAIVLVCIRPVRVVGVSDESLAYALREAVGGELTGTCKEKDDGDWLCMGIGSRPAAGSNYGPTAAYTVDVSGWGCWTAARVQKDSKLPPVLDGCITIFDLIRLGD